MTTHEWTVWESLMGDSLCKLIRAYGCRFEIRDGEDVLVKDDGQVCLPVAVLVERLKRGWRGSTAR